MEWIKRMSLKKSLFTMALLSLVIAALLSALTFWLGMELSSQLSPQGPTIFIDVDGGYTITEDITAPTQDKNDDILRIVLLVLQILLPILFFVIALLATVFLFYRWKLKEPLKILMDGANHIIDNDLDFSIKAQSTDELDSSVPPLKLCGKRLLRITENCGDSQKNGNGSMQHFPMI